MKKETAHPNTHTTHADGHTPAHTKRENTHTTHADGLTPAYTKREKRGRMTNKEAEIDRGRETEAESTLETF